MPRQERLNCLIIGILRVEGVAKIQMRPWISRVLGDGQAKNGASVFELPSTDTDFAKLLKGTGGSVGFLATAAWALASSFAMPSLSSSVTVPTELVVQRRGEATFEVSAS